MLNLVEELYLIAIHEEKGDIVPSLAERTGFALSGAVLAELALQNRLRVEEGQRVMPIHEGLTGTGYLDEALQKIQTSDRPRKISHWINVNKERSQRFQQTLGEQLAGRGVLRLENDRFFPVIPQAGSLEDKRFAKFWVKHRLREMVLVDGEMQLCSLALLSLARSGDILELIFTKDERKTANRRIYELMVGEALRNPVAGTIEEICRAVESLTEAD